MAKNSLRVTIFWVAVILLVVIPTSYAAYLAVKMKTGGFAAEISAQISDSAGLPISIAGIEFDKLDMSDLMLKNVAVRNHLSPSYPYFESPEIAVHGYSSSPESHVESLDIPSWTAALPYGAESASGEGLRGICKGIITTFIAKSRIERVRFGRGRFIVLHNGIESVIGVKEGSIERNSGKVVGRFAFDLLADKSVEITLTFEMSGAPGSESLSAQIKAAEFDAQIIEALKIPLPDVLSTVSGKIAFTLAYSAGSRDKDRIALSINLAQPALKLKDRGEIRCIDAKASVEYISESGTFPNVQSLLASAFDVSAKTAKYVYDQTSIECSVIEGEFDFSSRGVKGLIRKFSDVKVHFLDKLIEVASLSCELSYDAGIIKFNGSGAFEDEAKANIGGKILDPFGEPSGELNGSFFNVPSSIVGQFVNLNEGPIETTYSPVTGNFSVNFTNKNRGDGSFNIHSKKVSLRYAMKDLPAFDLTASGDFSYTDGKIERLRNARLELGQAGSFNGEITFIGGALSRIEILELRLSSGFMSSCISQIIGSAATTRMDGTLLFCGSIGDIDSDLRPGQSTLTIKVTDELTFSHVGKETSILLEGVTGSITLVSARKDKGIEINITGSILPQNVLINSKKMFLSGKRTDVRANLKYSPALASLTFDEVQLDSGSGLSEEIKGTISDLFTDPYLDLTFNDSGMSLEQIREVFEVAADIDFRGGKIALERHITGRLSSLKTLYSLKIDNLTIATKRIKLEGASILLEFE